MKNNYGMLQTERHVKLVKYNNKYESSAPQVFKKKESKIPQIKKHFFDLQTINKICINKLRIENKCLKQFFFW